ncbi:HypC/HybG/HupF family hydrogenase formation chaperone [Pseudonocardia sp. MH-G8]|uniref:HypC/HybG/HupF family hydrogenase formation chaperone n=1 Tax=Pseudonocardia sp. MH-G8 TaxID=1854588 RepID=UPI000BA05DF7|nr:HypC/HybG/HupF family hydrogenase formation chaperone [Pseudonocardia sp. MH-G8]OZM75597.1 hydrogenase assembly protein HupF [Pseudonocardia sp. MH-G8]
MTTVVDHGIDEGLSDDLAAASFALARRFSAGATMWCLAPAWEPHAQHVAVEFVHPVIVGKKALPAVALTGRDLVGSARVSVRSGDIVVAVASAADADVRAVMRRAPAWGATTIWIGSGARPPAGAADHVLWIEDPDPRVPATGGFVLLYHLLWELTHVCFEHPGLLVADQAECTDEVCITCSDEGRLGEVVSPSRSGSARVRTAEGIESVATVLVDPVEPGQLLLVHAGMAISTVREEDSE